MMSRTVNFIKLFSIIYKASLNIDKNTEIVIDIENITASSQWNKPTH